MRVASVSAVGMASEPPGWKSFWTSIRRSVVMIHDSISFGIDIYRLQKESRNHTQTGVHHNWELHAGRGPPSTVPLEIPQVIIRLTRPLVSGNWFAMVIQCEDSRFPSSVPLCSIAVPYVHDILYILFLGHTSHNSTWISLLCMGVSST